MIIDLGNKNKVVTYGENGVKNCLELCKTILKKYGLKNFGSSNNALRLMQEMDGKLVYFSDEPQKSYKNAIDCIDEHLNNNLPIIVGVNHTIGNTYNEGTTDHFVVIYGKGYDSNEKCVFYTYYEVGKTKPEDVYNDKENRLFYIDNKKPLFYDFKSQRMDGKRFDVTQVRPNMV
jgi:hypothetical protein